MSGPIHVPFAQIVHHTYSIVLFDDARLLATVQVQLPQLPPINAP